MGSLANKTLFITGGSRGIGEAIGVRAAQDGANIVIAAKTVTAHAKLPGTIHTAAEKMRAAGGQALGVAMDIRDEAQIQRAVEEAVGHFGSIDILINNASAIQLTGTLATPLKRFDLMHQVNVRGTFACAQACIPHLAKAENPHILTMSPPLNMTPAWFGPHLAYTLSKYGMSMCVLGLAHELLAAGIAVNALWPRTVIATAALQNIPGGQQLQAHCRLPAIVAEAAYQILCQPSRAATGQFYIDEDVLRAGGMTDFSEYAVDATQTLQTDLFL